VPGALLALGLTVAASEADIEALERAWVGARDSSEEVTVGAAGAGASPDYGNEQRVHTVVEPVQLPWLGPHGLYLEESPSDEPGALRRQLLMKLEPAGTAHEIRARLFTFVDPTRWAHLERRPRLQQRLRPQDLQRYEGCDLVLAREGAQFKGGTAGGGCLDRRGGALYVDYQLVIGESLYWYRRRLVRRNDGALKEEVVGFNWFELNDARLFSCGIDFSPSGRAQDFRALARMDLHDKGGRGELTTPDGRHLQLTLHSQDWPYAAGQDSLVLLLSERGESVPFAAAWAVVDEDRISLSLSWLRARCAAVEPDPLEVQG
jgi:hypothetical protein